MTIACVIVLAPKEVRGVSVKDAPVSCRAQMCEGRIPREILVFGISKNLWDEIWDGDEARHRLLAQLSAEA